ncbi:MAG: bifunctional serine/threonine protein kinase/MFS transporter [Myxococcota bacterium]
MRDDPSESADSNETADSSETYQDLAAARTHDSLDPDVHIGESDSLVPRPSSERFHDVGILGVGGMGKVELIRDHWIGRELARKTLGKKRQKDARALNAFMREAKVQGQLDHPAVVPVHDFGFSESGAPFFTMKRIRGRTLRELMDQEEPPSRRRLLEAFHRVCLSLDYAHARGVIHRDLKPENVMLGDFGEVYVLDWGIARLLSEPSDGEALDMEGIWQSSTDAHSKRVPTGTIGYMSPEQVRCEALDVTSDVYGLGLILFELLTKKRAHPTKLPQVFYSTLQEVPRASERAPDRDIPPELDEACAQALALKIEDRLPSARALASLIQSYLDGDRDLALRRDRAADALSDATSLLAEARTTGDETKRRAAGQKLALALAFAPQDAGVRQTLLELLTDHPTRVPDEVREQLAAERVRRVRRSLLFASSLYAALGIGAACLLLLSDYVIADRTMVGAGFVSIAISAIGSLVIRRLKQPSDVHLGVLYLFSCVAIAVLSRITSPWVLVPVLVITNTFGYLLIGGPSLRRFLVVMSVLLVPAFAFFDQWGGGVATASVSASGVIVTSQMVQGAGVGWLFFAVPMIAAVVFAIFLYSAIDFLERSDLIVAQHELQRWRFRQLLPEGVGSKLEMPAMRRGQLR